ncbi:MAG: hypothetical protein KC646_05125 [Candidatus Cloacimonetes bacterium]|nr:hypothetical protein [Candidatus Cloacimonadota bacterium]
MYILLSLIFVSNVFTYDTSQAISIANKSMFDLLVLVPGVILCSFVRGYLFEKLRYKCGDHNGSANPSKDPIQYVDPYGSICGIAFGFCWPKMPDYYPRHFNKPIKDEIYIYSIMSIANLAIAGIFLIIFMESITLSNYLPYNVYMAVSSVCIGVVQVNVMTGVFSFAPVYGLPGYLLLIRHLDYRTVFKLQKYLSLSILLGVLCLIFGVGHIVSNIVINSALSLNYLILATSSVLLLIMVFVLQLKARQKA